MDVNVVSGLWNCDSGHETVTFVCVVEQPTIECGHHASLTWKISVYLTNQMSRTIRDFHHNSHLQHSSISPHVCRVLLFDYIFSIFIHRTMPCSERRNQRICFPVSSVILFWSEQFVAGCCSNKCITWPYRNSPLYLCVCIWICTYLTTCNADVINLYVHNHHLAFSEDDKDAI